MIHQSCDWSVEIHLILMVKQLGMPACQRHAEKFHLKRLKNEILESNPKLDDWEKDIAPKVELKPLHSSLEQEFLDSNSYLVIVNVTLNDLRIEKLLRAVRMHRKVIRYTDDDIKGINPSFCMHRILMKVDHKPSMEHQCRLNPQRERGS